ncbi:MAG: hypothetical protein JXQ87_02670 [Bacteroidia bacterium]
MKIQTTLVWLSLGLILHALGCQNKRNTSDNVYIRPDSIYADLESAIKNAEHCKTLIIRNVLPSGQSLSEPKLIDQRIKNLSSLRQLIIFGPGQKEIPVEIAELNQLELLQIEGYGKVTTEIKIPDLSDNKNLNKLILNDCQLSQIPNLPSGLRYIEVRSNNLTALPKAIFSKHVRHINASKNQIMQLPKHISVNKLMYLNLSENNLESYPSFTDAQFALGFLGLSLNPIHNKSRFIAKVCRLEAIGLNFDLAAPLLSDKTTVAWLTEPLIKSKDSIERTYAHVNFNWYLNSNKAN